LFLAWKEFRAGKRKKTDVLVFEKNLKENILKLHRELKDKTYKHSDYVSFYINDPKLRKINKATVQDRVLHHAIFRKLYPAFDKLFIFDSYSCRDEKGTHRAVNRLRKFAGKVSKNNTKTCFFLKCDVKKFFDSIDHGILMELIKKEIKDNDSLWLIEKIIKSFSAAENKGLPLGNITSQLFANIYLNELDKFIKHSLKVKYYIRYCDEFLIIDTNSTHLENLIPKVSDFVDKNLNLFLHPEKTIIKKYRQGVDFLGYVSFPRHRILRTKTKNRIINKIKSKLFLLKQDKLSGQSFNQTIQSYFGVLKHCNGHKIKEKIAKLFCL